MSTGPDQSPLVGEQMSAWLDDELPAAELELLAARLAASPELRARAARYSLVGSALRGSQPGAPSAGLAALQISARVSSALEEMAVPGVLPPARRPVSRLLPYAAAAGVALVAVALVPLLRPVTGPGAGSTSTMAAQTAMPPATLTPVRAQSLGADRMAPTGQASLSPRRLTSYLVYHGEYSGMLSAKLTDSHIVNNRAYAAAVQTPEQSAAR